VNGNGTQYTRTACDLSSAAVGINYVCHATGVTCNKCKRAMVIKALGSMPRNFEEQVVRAVFPPEWIK
jgi:hypothetical protein